MKSFEYYLDSLGEIGLVESVTKDVVTVSGLPSLKTGELVIFETGQLGETLFLYPESAEVLLLDETPVKNSTRTARTGEKISIPAGKELLGAMIDPLGKHINHFRPSAKPQTRQEVDKEPPGIRERTAVSEPLRTGVAVVDMLLPLGLGQRELIIGDRKTGKTHFLLQTVLTQAQRGTVCIWAAIGKKRSEIMTIENFFKNHGIRDKVIIVAAGAEDATGLIYLAPYSAVALGEFFKDRGQDSLVVLDDLTLHAKFYRELSLLSKRFPGRESYPVDVFFTHAAILERGGCFEVKGKKVTLSILPIAETNEGDLSGYIQTNLMSMTDGHLYFDRDLFSQARRPAINPFLSVTRVGRQTQAPLAREMSRNLLSFLVEYQKMSSYLHFGAELTEEVRKNLLRGERITDFFNQKAVNPLPFNLVIFILGGIWLDFWPEENPSSLRTIWDKLIKDYEEDKKFRTEVDEIINKAKAFEELLNSIKKSEILNSKHEIRN